MVKLNEKVRVTSNQRVEFDRLVLPHLDALYRLAVWLTRNPHEAEDLVQDTCLRAFRSFETFEAGTNCRAWLFRILVNANINRARKSANRMETLGLEELQPFLAAKDTTEGSAFAQSGTGLDESLDGEVRQALADLPEAFRTPTILSVVDGLTYKEISRTLHCPIGTVMSRIYRGRQLLKHSLAGYARAHGYVGASASVAAG
jgi:RNA polymerase sigma-70 factor (ECF subfamily)